MHPAPPVTSTRIGASVVLRVECSEMRRIVIPTLVVVVLVGAAAILFVLRQTGAFAPSVHDQLKKLAKGSQPAWYLGEGLGGLKLTGAATGKARRIAAFGYGSCHRVGSRWNPFGLTSCG